MKRVFLVHGWDGHPRNSWFPAVRAALQKKGFVVAAPRMPQPHAPKIGPWVATLKKAVGNVDADTYFIGHSVGCQTIIRFLGSQDKKCGGAVFVAGWFRLTPEATGSAADRKIAAPWLLERIPFEKARRMLKKSTAFLSRDDPYVPLADKDVFRKTLGTKVTIINGFGHFTKDDGVMDLPEAAAELMRMAR